MPVSLYNTSSTFQHLMEQLFEDQKCQLLPLYVDDIVVFSSSVSQHLQHLELVLGHLQQDGLKAKMEKCVFFQQEVWYLGYVISSQGVSTDPSKIRAIANWCRPTMILEL